jgi:hypothetical protein
LEQFAENTHDILMIYMEKSKPIKSIGRALFQAQQHLFLYKERGAYRNWVFANSRETRIAKAEPTCDDGVRSSAVRDEENSGFLDSLQHFIAEWL